MEAITSSRSIGFAMNGNRPSFLWTIDLSFGTIPVKKMTGVPCN